MAAILKEIECRSVLERAKPSSRFKCTYQINPYIGCVFGCLYCSKSIDGEQNREKEGSGRIIHIKTNAPVILKSELRKTRLGLVCICGYQPVEREQRIIRQILDVLAARAIPVHIIAKSEVLLDDLDIIKRAAENNFCSVSLCINTLDEIITNTFEPNTPPPKVRVDVLKKLVKAGVATGLAIMPVIPYITDSQEQLDELISLAADNKAHYVLFDTLRLENDCRGSVIRAVKRQYPEVLFKYRRLYDFGAVPESRYTRQLRGRIRQLLNGYDLEEGIPYHEVDRKSQQVKLENYRLNS